MSETRPLRPLSTNTKWTRSCSQNCPRVGVVAAWAAVSRQRVRALASRGSLDPPLWTPSGPEATQVFTWHVVVT